MLAFCLGGATITVLVGIIVYEVCDSIAYNRGNVYALWPAAVAAVLGIISIVLWCIFATPLFEPICSNGHKNDMTAHYCIECGVDLEPSCICGHVWLDEEYCPDCGRAYEK